MQEKTEAILYLQKLQFQDILESIFILCWHKVIFFVGELNRRPLLKVFHWGLENFLDHLVIRKKLHQKSPLNH